MTTEEKIEEGWPQWLIDADTEDAVVEIVDGVVHWKSGIWHDGTWHGGIWHDGAWHGGREAGSRCLWYVYATPGSVTIGCKTHTVEEWDRFFASDEVIETPRGTEAFRLIERAYKAARVMATI